MLFQTWFAIIYNDMRNKRLLIIFGILLSLTLLIAIGSAIFGIKTVNAHCYNVKVDDKLIAQVLEDTDKIKGRSIFFLNEDELIDSIEKRVGGIKVVNIERLFPNRISINFVKLYEYFEVYYNGNYYISGIDGRVLNESAESAGEGVIKILMNFDAAPVVGGTFQNAARFSALQDMIDMLERLDYTEANASSIIKTIDFVYRDSAIYVTTREGVIFKLISNPLSQSDEGIGQKLRYALSLYVNKAEYRRGGMIIVVGAKEFTYTTTSDYTNVEEK